MRNSAPTNSQSKTYMFAKLHVFIWLMILRPLLFLVAHVVSYVLRWLKNSSKNSNSTWKFISNENKDLLINEGNYEIVNFINHNLSRRTQNSQVNLGLSNNSNNLLTLQNSVSYGPLDPRNSIAYPQNTLLKVNPNLVPQSYGGPMGQFASGHGHVAGHPMNFVSHSHVPVIHPQPSNASHSYHLNNLNNPVIPMSNPAEIPNHNLPNKPNNDSGLQTTEASSTSSSNKIINGPSLATNNHPTSPNIIQPTVISPSQFVTTGPQRPNLENRIFIQGIDPSVNLSMENVLNEYKNIELPSPPQCNMIED